MCTLKTPYFQFFALLVDDDVFFLLRPVKEGERMETVTALLMFRRSSVKESKFS